MNRRTDKFLVATVCMSVALAMRTAMAGCRNVNQGQQSYPMPTTTSSSVSSPTTTPAPVATKKTVHGVTRKAYGMMADGMTKAQCDEIVGFSGEIYKSYQYAAGSRLGAGGYFVRWKKGNSEISAQFDNGSLTMKFNENLNDRK